MWRTGIHVTVDSTAERVLTRYEQGDALLRRDTR